MKRFIYSFFVITVLCLTCMGIAFARVKVVPVYRVYNSESGEHLYTTNTLEVTTLVDNGWTDEKTAWVAPNRGEPVYRLYNPGAQLHLYTKDENEISVLTAENGGWQLDNNGGPLFFSDGDIPIYRLYSPVTGDHHLTTDENEYKVLGKGKDWRQEGVAFYATEAGSTDSGYGIDPYADLPKHETVKMLVLDGRLEPINEVDDTKEDEVTDTDNTNEHNNGITIPEFEVFFTPINGGQERSLGTIINTDLVGTDYFGVQIGRFEAGTYTLRYKVPRSSMMCTGSIKITQSDFDNCEKIQQPTGVLQLVYKKVQLSLAPYTDTNI